MTNEGYDDVIWVERSWPPLRIWGYLLLPAVIAAIPAPFLGVDYWAAAGGLVGTLLLIGGISLVVNIQRHWWFTAAELRVSRLPFFIRIFYPGSGGRLVPLENIDKVEPMAGKSRAIQREVFGSTQEAAKTQSLGGCEKFWCKGAVIARLSRPDEYGDTVLLSTDRPQEASNLLVQTINGERQRWGTAT